MESLLGIEGLAARIYFEHFDGMIKTDRDILGHSKQVNGKGRDSGEGWLRFDFEGRNRRPPRDPVNALLSLGYSLLAKDLTIACASVGLDPYLGFYRRMLEIQTRLLARCLAGEIWDYPTFVTR